MPNWKKIDYLPNLDFGWETKFSRFYTIGTVPFGRVLLDTVRINRPLSEYIAAGFTALQINGGATNSRYTGKLPVENRWVCPGMDFIRNATGNKNFASYGPSDADAAADSFTADRDYTYCIPQSLEGDGNNFANPALEKGDIYEVNPTMWVRIQNRLADNLAALGANRKNYGPYPGCMRTPDIADDAIVTALTSKANALAYMKGAGKVTAWNPYFYEEMWHKNHVIVNIYYSGKIDDAKWIYDLAAKMLVPRMAMDETGSGKTLLAFCEGVDNEATGYTARYQRNLDAGGYHVTYDWPPRPFGSMYFGYLMANIFLHGVAGFASDVNVSGSNPAVIRADGDRSTFFPNGTANNPQRAGTGLIPIADGAVLPYPILPVGYEDSRPLALRVWSEAAKRVGNDKYFFPTIQRLDPTAGTLFTPTADGNNSFLRAQYNAKLPLAIYMKPDSGTGRELFVFWNGGDDGPGTYGTFRFVCAGVSVDVELCGGVVGVYTTD